MNSMCQPDSPARAVGENPSAELDQPGHATTILAALSTTVTRKTVAPNVPSPVPDLRSAPSYRRLVQATEGIHANPTTDAPAVSSEQLTAPARSGAGGTHQLRAVERLIRNWRILHRRFWNPHLRTHDLATDPGHEHTTDVFAPPPNAAHSASARGQPGIETTDSFSRNGMPCGRTIPTRSPPIDRGPPGRAGRRARRGPTEVGRPGVDHGR